MSYDEDYEDEEREDGSLMITMGEDGMAKIHKPEDYVEMLKEEAELMMKFLKENQELFKEFLKKEGLDKDGKKVEEFK